MPSPWLRAPVATSYMGKGAFPEDHPLSAGSACDEAAFKELVERADVVLAVGTELGAETTQQYTLELGGQIVQIDAAAERIGATYPALGLVGDARAFSRLLRAAARAGAGRPRGGRAAPYVSGSPAGSTSRAASWSAGFSKRSGTRSRRRSSRGT